MVALTTCAHVLTQVSLSALCRTERLPPILLQPVSDSISFCLAAKKTTKTQNGACGKSSAAVESFVLVPLEKHIRQHFTCQAVTIQEEENIDLTLH